MKSIEQDRLECLQSELQTTRELLLFEQKRLNDLATAALAQGAPLSADSGVLLQNQQVHQLIVKIMQLKEEIAAMPQ